MNLHRVPLDPTVEPTTPRTRVEDGEGGIWELRVLYGDPVWYGPNTAIAEWKRVARVQPLFLLAASSEVPGQGDLFDEATA